MSYKSYRPYKGLRQISEKAQNPGNFTWVLSITTWKKIHEAGKSAWVAKKDQEPVNGENKMSSFRINTNVLAMNALRNLGSASNAYGQSVQRLSTGLRINSGADDPAGLQISEGFRSTIAGMTQAIRNNSDATNYAKTAEGALSEVNTLLTDARALALANANDATLTVDQKQANQNQLNSIMSSIDRISQTTAFGSKKLLDGSAGVTAVLTDTSRVNNLVLGGTLGAASVTAGGAISVNVTTAAVQASLQGNTSTAGTAITTAGTFAINGVTFNVNKQMTYGQVQDLVNSRTADTGVQAFFSGGKLTFQSTKYGTVGNNIQVVDQAGTVGMGTNNLAGGVNAAATVTVGSNSGTFTAIAGQDGLSLKDADGNQIKLTAAGGTATGTNTVGQATVSLAQFQIGGEAGQTATLALANTAASSLGLNASSMDIMNSGNLATAIQSLDTAITTVSRMRGDIGNFQRNVIDSNVRALNIAKENLTSSESSIRDVDMAEEMSTLTKYQILQQAGMSVLAQANQAPQSILSLLKG